ncbi:DUF3572 domain-containing protein [Sandarakinorhabdus sp.]|uniref:DUF3572 domain-containing protein n=1 Tax=Sandarakinorhabdus sp. TaxID=1916663 RepID=UPI00286D763E|nr:DUF3572 domain-containing protein [Sandarakinorhabdus sp.]
MLRDRSSSADPAVLALQALAHVAGDEDMGPRFLALTGMDADALRATADRPETLTALLDYLMANEHDLLATAEAIGVTPETLAVAARKLGSNW